MPSEHHWIGLVKLLGVTSSFQVSKGCIHPLFSFLAEDVRPGQECRIRVVVITEVDVRRW